MRLVSELELVKVSGGTDAVQAAKNVCTQNKLPADTKITITITSGTDIGALGIGTDTETTIEIETTCGDLTKPQQTSK
jgi:hypothetical protein